MHGAARKHGGLEEINCAILVARDLSTRSHWRLVKDGVGVAWVGGRVGCMVVWKG